MSWWVNLKDSEGSIVKCRPHAEGGTYVVGGIDRAELNITYNYGGLFRELQALGENGLKAIDGKRAVEVIPVLRDAVRYLGIRRQENYWAAVPGNAGHALSILLDWAREHPNAVFEVH